MTAEHKCIDCKRVRVDGVWIDSPALGAVPSLSHVYCDDCAPAARERYARQTEERRQIRERRKAMVS